MIYILPIILTVILIILIGYDIVVLSYKWQSRIHIGRWTNLDIWKKAVVKRSINWLRKTPVITITDQKRLIVLDMVKGNHKSQSIQSWQKAALLLGLIEVYDKEKDIHIKSIIQNFVNNIFDKSGNWKEEPKHIDAALLAFALHNVKWLDQNKYKLAFDFIYNLIIEHIGKEGTVMYRKNRADFRYVDSIGFICPFLVAYGKEFNKPKAIDLAIKQIREFNKYALLKDTNIPCHSYNIKAKIPSGLFGWGRGLGWYAIGLIDSWKELPDNYTNKDDLTKIVISFAKMAIKFQNENGSWNWLVTDNKSQADSSATATLAWFLANASIINEIKSDANLSKEKALKYLMTVTRRNGAIDFSQGDTKGIGVYSQNFNILPFTQGFVLRTLYYK